MLDEFSVCCAGFARRGGRAEPPHFEKKVARFFRFLLSGAVRDSSTAVARETASFLDVVSQGPAQSPAPLSSAARAPSAGPATTAPRAQALLRFLAEHREPAARLTDDPGDTPVPTPVDVPRFITFLGVEAPKLSDILPAQKDSRSSELPIHGKDVCGSTSIDELLQLPRHVGDNGKLKHATRWCTSTEPYLQLLVRAEGGSLHFPLPTAYRWKGFSHLSRKDIRRLLAIGKFAKVDPHNIKCEANFFAVPELLKNRRRPITEALLNDLMVKSDLAGIKLPQAADVRRMIGSAKYVVMLDAAAFYDQFRLHPDVALFFGCRRHSFVQQTLPMGFRPSADIAHLAAEALLDFDHPTVQTIAYIDNFVFAANNLHDLRAALREFRARCKQVGVVLNEPDDVVYGAAPEDGVCTDEFECLGERYSLANGTRSLTSSSLAKLRAAVQTLNEVRVDLISLKRIAAVFGIAFFATRVIDVSPAPFFDAIGYYRRIAALAQISGWSSTAPRPDDKSMSQLSVWLLQLLANAPVPITDRSFECDLTITVDASLLGWGAILERNNGTISIEARPWSPADHANHSLWSSTVAEPLAVIRAAIAGISSSTRFVRVFSDHLPLVYAGKRGYARARVYNDTILRLRELFPWVTFDFVFVAGINNPADPFSRGLRGWTRTDGGLCGNEQFSNFMPSVWVG